MASFDIKLHNHIAKRLIPFYNKDVYQNEAIHIFIPTGSAGINLAMIAGGNADAYAQVGKQRRYVL